MSNELHELIRKYALLNAIKYNGKAQPGPVISKILAEKPELKANAKQLVQLVNDIVDQVNLLTAEQ
ncbi:MAG: glutamate--tRNA ligase, partial [Saccharolobus sp.]